MFDIIPFPRLYQTHTLQRGCTTWLEVGYTLIGVQVSKQCKRDNREILLKAKVHSMDAT